ncbi:hypothetical protein [Mycolicibacterium pyrenivorans]|uniref:hypothetical protein n=1 Tax=Mycolicibacterium pyrenivorans TaxID=187102 RepID=UPI0021F3423A|nr:hypothetical protein [Mycolicibacterium pyrenivorans]
MKLLLEPLDFLMCFAVDLFEPAAGMPDQLSCFFDSFGHVAVEVRVVDHRLRRAIRALTHRVDHLPRVRAAEVVGRATDRRCRHTQLGTFLTQRVRGIRP